MRNLLRGMLVVICCMAGIAAADEKNILVTSGSDRATERGQVLAGYRISGPILMLPVGSLFCLFGIVGNFLDPKRLELETAQ